MIKWLLGTPPKIGSRWRWREGSPFSYAWVATVIAVKDGYVQYDRDDLKYMNPNDTTIRIFRSLYKEIDG